MGEVHSPQLLPSRDKALVGLHKGKIIPRSALGTQAGISGRPKDGTEPSCSQGAEIPFKELQVPWRRPQLLEAGTCPHAGMVVYQVLQVGVYLQNRSGVSGEIIKGSLRSPIPESLEDKT